MKKTLILILIGLLLILSIFLILKGVELGKTEILGIKEIQQRSAILDEKIEEASKLAERDYKQAVSSVEQNTKSLQQQKKQYEEMTAISEDEDVEAANQIERYEIETLWVKLGNHATSEGAIMKMDVVQGTNVASNVYNLQFTVTGSYISITDFISDIENDSTLGFKIEEFTMKPNKSDSNSKTQTVSDLVATFVCKDIAIKDVTEMSNINTNEEVNAGTTINIDS